MHVLATPCYSLYKKISRSGAINTIPAIWTPWAHKSGEFKPESICPIYLWMLMLSSQQCIQMTLFSREAREMSEMEAVRLLSRLAAHKELSARHGEASCTTCDNYLPPTCRWCVIFFVTHRRKWWYLVSVIAFWLQNWKLKMVAEVSSWPRSTLPNCTSDLPTCMSLPTQVRALTCWSAETQW